MRVITEPDALALQAAEDQAAGYDAPTSASRGAVRRVPPGGRGASSHPVSPAGP
ncbi:hypothetical protein [Streptomyces sp. 3N207]|uniref:hypothetical protein n=1 Tax=Streptomyces sp. 3N207 TaxID=3457417 RepID=UPI003FCF6939